MMRIGLRDARSHLGRFAMSIIAIALGVGFVVGSFCFREMLNNQTSQMMATNADHDVYVRGVHSTDDSSESSSSSTSSLKEYNSISTSLIATIKKVSGVTSAVASENISLSGVVLVGSDGNAVSTLGAPTLAIAMSGDHPWRSATITSGHLPKNDNEIVLDDFAAKKAGLSTGDKATMVFADGPRTMTVVGIFSTSSSQAGAILIGVSPALVTHYSDSSGHGGDTTSMIGVYGSSTTPLSDAEQKDLARRINDALPSGSSAHAITGDELRKESTDAIQSQLGFVQPLILIFAVIALFVGSFIIANTFSMIVRESMRGYALLRSIGASPRQVFLTVVVQALVLGVIGASAGVGLGWGMVRLIIAVLSARGMPLTSAVSLSVKDVVVGVAVGITVSVMGSAIPARRASLTPPIQAMNETVNPEKPVWPHGVLGTAMLLVGGLSWALTYVLATSSSSTPTPWPTINRIPIGWPLGIGAGLIVLGVIVMGPALIRPAGAVLGWIPSHLFPVTGRLATRNLSRSTRRSSNTAASLFVGIAIVSCLAVIATSAKASVSSLIDNGLKADFAVMSASYGEIPAGAVDALRRVDGVGSLNANHIVVGLKYNGKSVSATTVAAQSTLFSNVFAADSQSGDPTSALGEGELVVGSTIADDNNWSVGDTITVGTGTASGDLHANLRLRVGAIVENSVYRSSIIITDDVAGSLVPKTAMPIGEVFVSAASGTSTTTLGKALRKAVKPYYVITVMTRDQYKSTISDTIDSMIMILYALLALSIIIAIVSIVNTLALNVSERTREIGLLRAIGTSRAQIRGMLGIEAAIISVFGTIAGVIVGTVAGAMIRAVYEQDGMETLAIPWSQLAAFVAASIVVGLLASVSPASHALRKPVLEAVSSD
ncbi:FtsX-like permease family protein [uncultured Bifidobacterium sp.]|uniref:ABC transporter permease n=1 Tax=uncultured Bifidobacterium sp. TaxID=165187 RepID=UPI00260F2376|nr:FtsX-like permease family protein [uncultured Bifidobacterium sp.]